MITSPDWIVKFFVGQQDDSVFGAHALFSGRRFLPVPNTTSIETREVTSIETREVSPTGVNASL